MELSELQLLQSEPTKLINKIKSLSVPLAEEAINFEPENHKVYDIQHRPYRQIDVSHVNSTTGEVTYTKELKDVHRIPSAIGKAIISWSVDLALSGGVAIDCKPITKQDETILGMVENTLSDVKMDFFNQEIEYLTQRWCKTLVVWYPTDAEEGFWGDLGNKGSKKKMKFVIHSPEYGDELIPIRDQYKDLIGCARGYKVTIDDKEVEKIDLLLSDKNVTYSAASGGWVIEKETAIPIKKASFILHENARRATQDVEPKMDRIEEIDSDTSEENKSSAFPILVAKGKILATSGGENANTRKTFELEGDSDLKYVEATGAAVAATAERKNLREDVYMESATPMLSVGTTTLGSAISGFAVELMFLPATNKAKSKQQGTIGIAHQRQLNLLKAWMGEINTDVRGSVRLKMTPKYQINLPRNKTEEIANIVSMVGAGLMSKETALKALAFTDNPELELEKINLEIAERAATALTLANANKTPITTT